MAKREKSVCSYSMRRYQNECRSISAKKMSLKWDVLATTSTQARNISLRMNSFSKTRQFTIISQGHIVPLIALVYNVRVLRLE